MAVSLKTRLFLALSLITGLVLANAVYNLRGQKATGALLRESLSRDVTAMHLAAQISHDFVTYDDLVFRYLSSGDESLLTESERIREGVKASMERLKNESESATVKELLSELDKESVGYFEDVKKLLLTALRGDVPGDKESIVKVIQWAKSIPVQQRAMSQLSAKGKEKLVLIYSLCDKLVVISRVHMEDVQRQIRATLDQSEKTVVFGGMTVFVCIALIGILLAGSILTPLRELQSGIQRILGGDLDFEIPPGGNDEIGQITQAFNGMTRQLRDKQQQLLKETVTDALTGLHNFRYFEEALKVETDRARRYNRPLSLIIIDIDHFKNYNDTHGHEMGNVVLKKAAEVLRETVRPGDVLARYGGEEFVVFLPDTDKEQCHRVAERAREDMAAAEFPGEEKQPGGKLTISVGVATFPSDARVAKDLVEKADKALFKAKGLGRNRVELAA